MSDQHTPIEHQVPKPRGNTGSVHGEVPLIRKKSELTPEEYKRQRTNLIFVVILVVLVFFGALAFFMLKDTLLGGVALAAPAAAAFPLLA